MLSVEQVKNVVSGVIPELGNMLKDGELLAPGGGYDPATGKPIASEESYPVKVLDTGLNGFGGENLQTAANALPGDLVFYFFGASVVPDTTMTLKVGSKRYKVVAVGDETAGAQALYKAIVRG